MFRRFLMAGFTLLTLAVTIGGAGGAGAHAMPAGIENFIWENAASPVTANLNSVAMVSANDGWAVGENGTVLHYDGKNWVKFSTPIPEVTTLVSIAMSSAQNGWILSGDSLYRWNGAQWSSAQAPAPPWPFFMKDIATPNETSAWVASGIIVCSSGPPCDPENALGTISHWDGSSWSYTSISNVFFSSIAMNSDSDGWAVGFELDQATRHLRSKIMHWNGYSWTAVDHPISEYPGGSVHFILEEIAALNSEAAWAAVSEENRFLHWNGTVWTAVYSPVSGRPAIAVVSASNAWSVGGAGSIAHWNGSGWASVPSPVSSTLTSVAMTSPFEGWAVGEGGVILHGSMPALNFYLPVILK